MPPPETLPPRPQVGDTERPPFSQLAQQEQAAERAALRKSLRPWWKDAFAPALVGTGAALIAVGGGLWGAANAQVATAGLSYDHFESAQSVGAPRTSGIVLLSIGAAAVMAGGARYLLVWQRNRDRAEERPPTSSRLRAAW
jgi:hypothetical protein